MIDIAGGGWDDEKSEWLRGELESRCAGILHVLLFMHQLPISGDGAEGRFIDRIDTRLARILEDDSVDYVFSGYWLTLLNSPTSVPSVRVIFKMSPVREML